MEPPKYDNHILTEEKAALSNGEERMRNQNKASPYRSTLIACYLGYITQAITVNLAPLFFVIFQNQYGVSYTQIANLVLITFVIQIIVDASMVKLTPIVGYRRSAVFAHIFSVIGLVCLTILPRVMPAYAGILISVFFYSIGGGLTEVVISPIVDALPGDAKASAMSLLHSFYSWGQMAVVILSTVLLSIVGNANWFYIPLVWAILPLCNIFLFARVPIVEPEEEQKSNGAGKFLRSPIFVVAVLMMICSGASEQAMSQWASLFAERGLGVPKIAGDLLGPCMFAFCMAIGRTVYGICGEKINIEKALMACAGLTIGCYIVVAFVPNPVVALLGCALTGLGVSLMWPGMLSYSSQKYDYKAGPVLFSLLALGGDIGCSVGPWITGCVSDTYLATVERTAEAESQAIRYGLLAAVIFPALMLVLSLIMRKLPPPKQL